MGMSSPVTIEVSLPRELLAESGLSKQQAGAEMLRTFVLSLYRRDQISTGKAAGLLGIHRMTFIRMLAEEGIPYLDYTSDELDEEFGATPV